MVGISAGGWCQNHHPCSNFADRPTHSNPSFYSRLNFANHQNAFFWGIISALQNFFPIPPRLDGPPFTGRPLRLWSAGRSQIGTCRTLFWIRRFVRVQSNQSISDVYLETFPPPCLATKYPAHECDSTILNSGDLEGSPSWLPSSICSSLPHATRRCHAAPVSL